MPMLEGAEIVTTAQMRAMESAAMGSGAASGLNLMTRAGRAVADRVRLDWPRAGRVTVLCDAGNNGGDGYVVARSLAEAGWRVRVLGAPTRSGGDAAAARARWPGPVEPLDAATFRSGPRPDLVIDAMLGAGLSRPPDPAIRAILAAMVGLTVVAVHGPSGLCLDRGILPGHPRGALPDDMPRAALTVTFDSPRPGHLLEAGPALCGRLVVADIGLSAFRRTGRITALWPRLGHSGDPARGDWLRKTAAPAGHKFTHGAALVVAGPAGHGGAARLAARAALRVGAGLVTLAPPASALSDHAGPPDALMCRLADDARALEAALSDRRALAVCIGPACGTDRAAALLPAIVAADRPTVLDADALTAWARAPGLLPRDTVLTPHQGEFARLFPDLARCLSDDAPDAPGKLATLRRAAASTGATVLLKGPDTVIAAPDGRAAIHSDPHLPWLATAGAGDVLAGLITGLMARGLPGFEAACLAVRLHGAAARLHGPGLIADDLIEALPALIRDWGG